jgi:hypothetical protein
VELYLSSPYGADRENYFLPLSKDIVDIYKSMATLLLQRRGCEMSDIVEDILDNSHFIKYAFRSVGILYAVRAMQAELSDDFLVACLNGDQQCKSIPLSNWLTPWSGVFRDKLIVTWLF